MPRTDPALVHLLLFVQLVFLLSSSLSYADKLIEEHFYQRTFGSETSSMKWQLLAGSPQLVKTEMNGESDQTELNLSLATRLWKIENPRQNTSLQVERQSSSLKISGTFKGKPVDDIKQIDDALWFQTMSISFRAFLKNKADTIYFWIIRPDTLGVHKLKAVKKGTVLLDIGGQQVEADKLELRLAGFGSLFWKAHYWFRKSDGLFLRYVGPGVLPGAPIIDVEWKASRPP